MILRRDLAKAVVLSQCAEWAAVLASSIGLSVASWFGLPAWIAATVILLALNVVAALVYLEGPARRRLLVGIVIGLAVRAATLVGFAPSGQVVLAIAVLNVTAVAVAAGFLVVARPVRYEVWLLVALIGFGIINAVPVALIASKQPDPDSVKLALGWLFGSWTLLIRAAALWAAAQLPASELVVR